MKYRTITLEIPEDQRLGQAIMNAFRSQWDEPVDIDALKSNWEGFTNRGKADYKNLQDYIDQKLQKKYWDIWELDQGRIQKAIMEMFQTPPH